LPGAWHRASPSRKAMFDLVLVVAVAILAVAIDIVLAVFAGVAVAALLFLVRMSRSSSPPTSGAS
jgi:MFS superfamily sulfate permease-like transporter